MANRSGITSKSWKIIKFSIRLLITTGLLIWLFNKIDLQQFWQTLKTTKWWFLAAVWATTIIRLYINSMKMRFILKKQDCSVGIATLFGASAITSLYSMIMPGMMSTAVKWYMLKKHTGKASNVLSSMVYNQFSIMVLVTIFGLAVLVITNPVTLLQLDARSYWLSPAVCGIMLAVIVLLSLLLLSQRTGGKIIKGASYVLKPFPTQIRQKVRKLLEQTAVFQTAGWCFHLVTIVYTIVCSLAGNIVMYILSAMGANIDIPIGVFVWLFAVIYVLGRLPISIAGLGVREVTLVSILKLYGVGPSAALLMSMILFSSSLFMALIGVFYQLSWTGSRKSH